MPQPESARLLVVEDEVSLREMLEDVLSGEGYAVATAENGLDALVQMERSGLPDLILLDLSMPVMNGHAFLDHLRARDLLKRVPVIVVSALAHRLSSEVAGIVPKPVDAWHLMETIRRVLSADTQQAR